MISDWVAFSIPTGAFVRRVLTPFFLKWSIICCMTVLSESGSAPAWTIALALARASSSGDPSFFTAFSICLTVLSPSIWGILSRVRPLLPAHTGGFILQMSDPFLMPSLILRAISTAWAASLPTTSSLYSLIASRCSGLSLSTVVSDP